MLDVASSVAAVFSELRSFALWKTTGLLQRMYSAQLQDSAVLLAASSLLLVVVRKQSLLRRTSSELLVLVSVNVLV